MGQTCVQSVIQRVLIAVPRVLSSSLSFPTISRHEEEKLNGICSTPTEHREETDLDGIISHTRLSRPTTLLIDLQQKYNTMVSALGYGIPALISTVIVVVGFAYLMFKYRHPDGIMQRMVERCGGRRRTEPGRADEENDAGARSTRGRVMAIDKIIQDDCRKLPLVETVYQSYW